MELTLLCIWFNDSFSFFFSRIFSSRIRTWGFKEEGAALIQWKDTIRNRSLQCNSNPIYNSIQSNPNTKRYHFSPSNSSSSASSPRRWVCSVSHPSNYVNSWPKHIETNSYQILQQFRPADSIFFSLCALHKFPRLRSAEKQVRQEKLGHHSLTLFYLYIFRNIIQ